MKHFKYYQLFLASLFFLGISLTSCNDEVQEQNFEHLRNIELENQLTQASFSKTITVKNSITRNQGIESINFIISSNDQSVIDAFDENAIVLKLGEFQSPHETLTYFGDETEYEEPKVDLKGLAKERPFAHITALGSQVIPTDETKMNYSVEFSTSLQDVMKNKNVAMIFDFGAEEEFQTKHQDTWRWWRNKLLVLDSAHNTRTKSHNYWAFTSSSYTYYLNYRDISEIGTTSVCCMYNYRRWVRRIVAFQGWYSAVNGIWFYCESGTCGSNYPH